MPMEVAQSVAIGSPDARTYAAALQVFREPSGARPWADPPGASDGVQTATWTKTVAGNWPGQVALAFLSVFVFCCPFSV